MRSTPLARFALAAAGLMSASALMVLQFHTAFPCIGAASCAAHVTRADHATRHGVTIHKVAMLGNHAVPPQHGEADHE